MADAKRYQFGSTMFADANHAIARPTDTAFWAKRVPGGKRVRAPAKGKLVTIYVKGTAVKHGSTPPLTLFHFQVLRPTGNGRVQVKFTSGNFNMPVGGNKNRITAFHPVNLCARKGDWVSFSDVGGFKPGSYSNGTPFRIFSNVAAAKTNIFRGKLNNGSMFKGNPHQGVELLMRMTLATGSEAGVCG
jgi:hypothetical protein